MKVELISKNRGVSLVELIIAIAILALGISASILLAFANQTLRVDSGTNSEALTKAESLLENERADSRLDFNLVNPIPSTNDGIYSKQVLVETSPDFFTKTITSIVSWLGEGGRNLSVRLSTQVTNPEGPNGGNTCNSVLSGDWTNPIIKSYELGAQILNDTSSGFPVTGIAALDKKLYVTANHDNGNNDMTFFILNISNPSQMPTPYSSIDNSPKNGKSDGLNAVATDGKYAYVASAYNADFDTCSNPDGTDKTCGQLQIIDVQNELSPDVIYTLKMLGVTGDQAVGRSIFLKDKYVYLGLNAAGADNGPEFHIIDVSDPTKPVHVGSWPEAGNEFNNSINSIYVRGNYAYLAHPTISTSPFFEQLTVLDISNPANPHRVSGFYSYDAIGGNGKSLNIVGNSLYFGRTASNISHSPDLLPEYFILDITNPTSIPTIPLGAKALNTAVSVNGIIVRDFLSFLITSEQFQIWRTDNPSNITQYANPLPLPPGSGNVDGTAADCEGNFIYVGSLGSNDKGYISTITAN